MLSSRLLLQLGFLITSVVHQGVWSYAHQCSITSIPDYLVWLNSSLLIAFNTTDYDANRCSYHLYKNMDAVPIPVKKLSSSYEDFGFPLPMVTKEFDNASMTVIAHNSNIQKSFPRHFTIRTVDNVSAVINFTYSNNCTHTIVEWSAPSSHGLMVTDYYYKLRLNDTVVESGVTVDPFVVFNLTSLPANVPGYSVSVWARAPPGNSTVTNISLLAAVAPNVSYIADVAISSQKAIFILNGEVNPFCPTSYPTAVTILISCVPGYIPLTRPVLIASNGSIEEIHSDAIDTGYSNCDVTVITSNFYHKNSSEVFNFSSTDIQQLVARPSEHTGTIYLWMRLARNSSIQEITVNITSSKGKLVNTTRIKRPLHQREVNTTTSVLPVDVYSVSVFSCYNKTLITSKTVKITHSNYSTTSLIPSFSNSVVPSSTKSPTANPTNNAPVIIGVVVAVLLVTCGVMTMFIILAGFLCCKSAKKRGRASLASQDRLRSVSYSRTLDQAYCDTSPPPSPKFRPNSPQQDERLSIDAVLNDGETGSDIKGAASVHSSNSLTPTPLDKSTSPDVPVVQMTSETNITPPTEVSSLVNSDDVPLPGTVSAEENQPVYELAQTTTDKATFTSVEVATPKSMDTSVHVLLPPPPPPPAFNRQQSVPSERVVLDLPRRPSQPIVQQTVSSDPSQQALTMAASRPSLTTANEDLLNLSATSIQDAPSTADQPVTFKISPSPPPSPVLPLATIQEPHYPTQETTRTTDTTAADDKAPLVKPSRSSPPPSTTTSRPQTVQYPVPETTTTDNSREQLLSKGPASDLTEQSEDLQEPFLTYTGREVSSINSRQSFVK